MFKRFVSPLARSAKQSYIFGTGGFASEVLGELSYLPYSAPVVAFVRDLVPHENETFLKLPVLSLDKLNSNWACACVAVGDPKTRRNIVSRLQSLGTKEFLNIVSADIRVHPTVRLGAGSILCRGVVPTVDVAIGNHVHVNIMSTLAHGVSISDFVTISPGVLVSGNVHIAEAAFIGTGATIINGSLDAPLTIGAEAVVAAGSVVTKAVPPRTMVAGVPAVIKKQW